MGDETFISDLRESVKALTEADPYFADIPIVTERLKNIQGRIDEVVGRLNGICLILVTPGVKESMPNVPGAHFRGIGLVGRVLENTTINKTGKEALHVAVYLCGLWSQKRPDEFTAALVPDKHPIVLGNDPKYLSYDIFFSTEGGARMPIPQLDAVQLTSGSAAGAIMLAHPTPGAAIFYTLDGTQPAPRNPSAALATGDILPLVSQKLRARAWLAGWHPSAELTQTF